MALTLYTDALHKYERIGGTQHISYLSTLNNLGVLYKTISAQSKGVKKTIMLERAEEALCDVYRLVGEIKGIYSFVFHSSISHMCRLVIHSSVLLFNCTRRFK